MEKVFHTGSDSFSFTRILRVLWAAICLFGLTPTAGAGTLNLNDFNQSEPLGLHFELFDDASGNMSLAEVLAPERKNQWVLVTDEVPNFGFTNHSIWFRSTVELRDDKPRPFILNVDYAGLEKVDLYVISNGNEVSHTSIGGENFNKRPLNERGFAFPVTFTAKRSQVLLRVYSPYHTVQTPIFLMTVEKFHDSRQLKNKMEGIFFGILAAMIFYNLFLYMGIKKNDYLFYVAFIFINYIFQSSISGIGYEHFWPNSPNWQSIAASILVPCTVISAVRFIIGFMEINKNGDQRALLTGLQIIMAMAFLGIVVTFIHPHPMVTLYSVVVAVLACTLVWYLALATWLSGYRPAKYFTIAWTIFLWGTVIRAANKIGILPFNDFTENIQQIGSVVEVLLLSFSLGDKINFELQNDQERIKSLNDRLTAYVGKVEILVEEQTRHIASIMSHIEQGIFTIATGMVIEKHYSKNLEIIIGKAEIVGKNPIELFLAESNLSKDDLSRIESCLLSSIGEPDFTFVVNAGHLPKEIRLHHKIIEMNWQCIVDGNGSIEKILVTTRDVTELRALEELSNTHKTEMTQVAELLAIAPKLCEEFFTQCQGFLSEIRNQLEGSDDTLEARVRAIFIQLHTMKGAARGLKLKSLVNAVHEAETHCSAYLKIHDCWDSRGFKADFEHLEMTAQAYVSINREKLGRTSNATRSLDARILDNALRLIETLPDHFRKEFFELEHSLRGMRYQSSTILFAQLNAQAITLAAQVEKWEPRLLIEGPEQEFPNETAQLLSHAFAHLLSNSLDHGLETAEERQAAGKTSQGTITIALVPSADGLTIVYRDDGRGLLLSRIREIGISKGLIAPQEKRPEIIANLIFAAGFSTSKKLSEISGRGIGMEAVRALLDKIPATLDIVLLGSGEPLDQPVPIEFRITLAAETSLPIPMKTA